MEGMPEFMGYDRAIVTFSPDGRLFQVEYAREAVKRGMTSVGAIFSEGVVLAAARSFSELSMVSPGSDKIHQLDDHLAVGITGFLADGRVLIDFGRVKAQIYKLTYDEPLNVMGAVREISDRMQLYTQYGGVRPFGVAFLVAGVDENGPQLFEVDPSAAFYGWKAQVIGKGTAGAMKILKEWKEKMSEDDAVSLVLRALKAGEKELKANEVELAVVKKDKFVKFNGPEGLKVIKKFW